MLVFFFPFFENLGSYVYDSMHARVYGFVFERHQRTMFFVEKLYGMRARALASKHAQRSLCMLAGARGASRDGSCSPRSCSRRQRRKVDKCRVADKKRTNQQTNTHYSFIGIDIISVACNLRTCAVCRLHGAKYAVCRLHGTQSADCMVTVQTKDPSKTCDSF